MKADIINGSPGKKGTTAALLHAIENGLRNQYEIKWIDAYAAQVKPCISCFK